MSRKETKAAIFSNFIKRRPALALSLAYLCSVIIFCVFIYLQYRNGSLAGFSVSFAAALLEDLVFFFFIGITLFVITLKKLEDNEIDVRLDTVISSPNVTASAREYFRKETKSVLAFYEKCNVVIKICGCDKETSTYKLYFMFDSTIINMCKDINFNVSTNAFVKPGRSVNENWGEVTILTIKDLTSGNEVGETVGFPKMLTESGYNETFPLLISANGKAEYKFGCNYSANH